MKKTIVLALAMMISSQTFAQTEYGCFNHLSVGVSAGFPHGIGVEVGTDLTKWAGARLGINVMPGIKYSTDVDVNVSSASVTTGSGTYEMEATANFSRVTGDFMLDFYPTGWFSVTAGCGFGGSTFAKVTGHSDELEQRGISGTITVDKYNIEVDEHGDMKGGIKMSSFRPYVGIGFGSRAVPKHRIGFHVDLGAYFHSSPEVYSGDKSIVIKALVKDRDSDLSKIVEKWTWSPQIKFTLRGRIL